MEPARKRVRKEAQGAPPKATSIPVDAEKESPIQQCHRGLHARREPQKMYVADNAGRDCSSSEDAPVDDQDEVSETEAMTPAMSAEAVEDALVREGDKLSGKALQDFLQKNFVEYTEKQLFDVDDLDAFLTTKP